MYTYKHARIYAYIYTHVYTYESTIEPEFIGDKTPQVQQEPMSASASL